jgi:VWFA-related protein
VRRILALAFVLASGAALAQQDQPPPPFRISVEAVTIDAVVTDRNGHIVSDLTADDFEVLQDGKRQKVAFAQFVPVLAGAVAPTPAGVTGTRADAPEVRVPAVRPEHIQRTLAIVVDDLSLSFESLSHLRGALHTFIDRDLQTTDLVALIRTGGSMGGLQPFTTDRRVLHAAIDAVRWNGFSRSGVESFDALNEWTTFDERSGLSDLGDFAIVNGLRRSMSAAGTLGALNLIIRGARDLPGRKALLLVTEGFEILERGGPRDRGGQPDPRVRAALDRAIDQATRAGVIVYSLDARGLQTGGLQASDNLKRPTPGSGLTMEETVRAESTSRASFLQATQEGMAYLSEQTGGFAVLNTNDLAQGMSRIAGDVRDYYIIGYVPAEGTFLGKGKKPEYHKLSVKVRRPGLRVRTRKEFLGVSDPEGLVGPRTPAQELIGAAVSPFTATEIALRATPLPGYVPERGLFVRTLLHIDARALTFADSADDRKTASADVLGMVFDRDGTEVAHLSTGFSVALTGDAAEDALRDGLAYTLRVPIPRAGAYQLRFAVRDRQSGKIGTAAEFVAMPDISGGEFALSGIALWNAGRTGLDDGDQIAVAPTQALRIYPAGTELTYAYEVYNAAQRVQSGVTIWRGTEKVLEVPPDTLVPPPGTRRFAAAGSFRLGQALPAGSYVLQIAAATADRKRSGRINTAVQRIDFDVR